MKQTRGGSSSADPRADIQRNLDRFRSFQECLLRELRFVYAKQRLELEFEYIWDRTVGPDEWKVAAKSLLVLVTLEPVDEAHISVSATQGLREDPSHADWGLSEVAIVSVDDPPEEAQRVTSRPLHKLVVAWENGQQIEAVFERLQIEDLGHRGGRAVAVVVRYDRFEALAPHEAVNLLKVFDDPDEAEAEAARLNEVGRGGAQYFVCHVRDRRGAS